jgi:Abnormal spindle-like microcephaly-assoc'd, ASPM-SPD-2-Hydin
MLTITSNDPKRPSVNVKLTGKGAPGRLGASVRLSFARTKATTSVSKNFTIKNSGPGVLHGNVGATTEPFKVTAGSGAFVLNHGERVTITVEFTPPASGPFTGSLALSSDDPTHTSVTVKLAGIGI